MANPINVPTCAPVRAIVPVDWPAPDTFVAPFDADPPEPDPPVGGPAGDRAPGLDAATGPGVVGSPPVVPAPGPAFSESPSVPPAGPPLRPLLGPPGPSLPAGVPPPLPRLNLLPDRKVPLAGPVSLSSPGVPLPSPRLSLSSPGVSPDPSAPRRWERPPGQSAAGAGSSSSVFACAPGSQQSLPASFGHDRRGWSAAVWACAAVVQAPLKATTNNTGSIFRAYTSGPSTPGTDSRKQRLP